jgi:hypothetical protein
MPWYIVTPLRLRFGRFNVLFWCHGMSSGLGRWPFGLGGLSDRCLLVKLALPGLQKSQRFHRNAVDLDQLDPARRRGVTMYQGRSESGRGRAFGLSVLG